MSLKSKAQDNSMDVEPKKTENIPWVEKYRPKKMDDVVQQDEVVNTLRKSIETGNLPHLLFYGTPGTGKTSTILAIANQLYGPTQMKGRVLELNASDERGIDVIRSKVKTFSSLIVPKNTSNEYPCPPYKIVILDEADNMTEDAQNALRRTIENYSSVTRFCLICNYVSRIIEPLASRCAKFRFRPLSVEGLQSRLTLVKELEGVNCNQDVINVLIDVSQGDMRRAITYLQSIHRLYGNKIDVDSVYLVSGTVPKKEITEALHISKSESFAQVQSFVNKLSLDGYSASQFFEQLHSEVIEQESLSNQQKVQIIEAIAKADRCLIDGADEFLQVFSVMSVMMRVMTAS